MSKNELPKTISELKEMRIAFEARGDQERAEAKAKFLRD